MTRARPRFRFLLATTLIGLSSPAFAYLDPGTGSMVVSAIIGIFATAILAIKTYWYKLVSFLRPKEKVSIEDNPVNAPGKDTET
ncbi:MAG: hypothetical protein U9R74_07960 [Pseudomonadota bacterium]|nr:hypothetical protein [Pseudomonadota bacterium]